MCRIERFDLVYPNDFREPRQRLFICPNGAANHPCDQTYIVDTEREFVRSLPEAPQPPPPRTDHAPGHAGENIQVLRPRSPHPRIDGRRSSSRSSPNGLRIVPRLWIPFRSRKVERNRKGDLVMVRQSTRHPRQPEAGAIPPLPYQPPPQILYPARPPLIEPPARPPPQPPAEVVHQPRTRPAPVSVIHHREESPEMTPPLREHHRRRNPTSPSDRLHETERQLAREQSRRRRAEEDAAEANQRARISDAERIRAQQEADAIWATNRRREEAERARDQHAREAREALTRAPRHITVVHQETGRGFEQRGRDFIRSAISARERDRRRAEEDLRNAGRDRRREGTDLTRRNTITGMRTINPWTQYGQHWPRED